MLNPRPIFVAAFLVAAVPHLLSAQSSTRPDTLTNRSVIDLVAGKVPRDLIIQKIKGTPATFDITASGLISLVAANVPKEYIVLMMDWPQGSATVKSELTPAPVAQGSSGTPSATQASSQAASAAPVFPKNCKPDISRVEKESKELVTAWSAEVFSPGFVNNGDISQVSTTVAIGAYGFLTEISVLIHRSETQGSLARHVSDYEASSRSHFFLTLDGGKELAFAATRFDNDITWNRSTNKLTSNVTIWATVPEEKVAAMRAALTAKPVRGVKLWLERGVIVEQVVNDKKGQDLESKLTCFYQSSDANTSTDVATMRGGTTSLSGTFVEKGEAEHKMVFRLDGTLSLTLADLHADGFYRVHGDSVAIQGYTMTAEKARLAGNTLVEADGTVWQKVAATPTSGTSTAMSNSDVIRMAIAKRTDDQIIAAIHRSTNSKFDLTPAGIASLKKAGVSDAVIRAMRP